MKFLPKIVFLLMIMPTALNAAKTFKRIKVHANEMNQEKIKDFSDLMSIFLYNPKFTKPFLAIGNRTSKDIKKFVFECAEKIFQELDVQKKMKKYKTDYILKIKSTFSLNSPQYLYRDISARPKYFQRTLKDVREMLGSEYFVNESEKIIKNILNLIKVVDGNIVDHNNEDISDKSFIKQDMWFKENSSYNMAVSFGFFKKNFSKNCNAKYLIKSGLISVLMYSYKDLNKIIENIDENDWENKTQEEKLVYFSQKIPEELKKNISPENKKHLASWIKSIVSNLNTEELEKELQLQIDNSQKESNKSSGSSSEYGSISEKESQTNEIKYQIKCQKALQKTFSQLEEQDDIVNAYFDSLFNDFKPFFISTLKKFIYSLNKYKDYSESIIKKNKNNLQKNTDESSASQGSDEESYSEEERKYKTRKMPYIKKRKYVRKTKDEKYNSKITDEEFHLESVGSRSQSGTKAKPSTPERKDDSSFQEDEINKSNIHKTKHIKNQPYNLKKYQKSTLKKRDEESDSESVTIQLSAKERSSTRNKKGGIDISQIMDIRTKELSPKKTNIQFASEIMYKKNTLKKLEEETNLEIKETSHLEKMDEASQEDYSEENYDFQSDYKEYMKRHPQYEKVINAYSNINQSSTNLVNEIIKNLTNLKHFFEESHDFFNTTFGKKSEDEIDGDFNNLIDSLFENLYKEEGSINNLFEKIKKEINDTEKKYFFSESVFCKKTAILNFLRVKYNHKNRIKNIEKKISYYEKYKDYLKTVESKCKKALEKKRLLPHR